MDEHENKRKAISLFSKLSSETKQQALLEMLNDGVIDLAPAMIAYARHLAEYKINARSDISVISQAGLDLAEKEIKKLGSMKSLNKRQLKTAQAQTLLSGGGYKGTKFQEELEKHVDMSIVDPNWYKQSWKLKTDLELQAQASKKESEQEGS